MSELAEQKARLQKEIRACRRCLEAGHAITPGPVFSHPRTAEVMLIGQAPGITEGETKRPFNAGSGRRLFAWLGEAGWREEDFRARQVMTAVTKCYPGKGKNGKGDRLPSRAEQKLCRPFLEQELAYFDPRLIIPVGGLAIKLFYPGKLRLDQIIGTAAYLPPHPSRDLLHDGARRRMERLPGFDPHKDRAGRWFVPLPHPSGASLWPNRPENQALIGRSVQLLAAIREAWNL